MLAVALCAGGFGDGAHLRGLETAHRQGDAGVEAARLLLGVESDMGQAILRRAWQDMPGVDPVELAAEPGLNRGQEPVEAPRVDHVFQARLGAVGAVAVVDEHAHDRVGHLGGIGWRHDDAGGAREVLVAGDAAYAQAIPDARRHGRALGHRHGGEADVVGLLERRDRAATVEADVELARQAAERAVIEDVEVPAPRVGPRCRAARPARCRRWHRR